jgi:hypothetical protein
VFAVVLATAACIRPSEKLTCGDSACPLSNVCIDNAYCVVPEAVTACDGKAGGDDCTFDQRPGHCVDHSQLVCEPATCGDNIIDEELHEQCDGTASFGTQCVDLGFDMGRPTCSVQCGIDVQPCTRFGWQPLVNAPAVAMWTDGTVIAYARRNPDSLEITGGGNAISVPGFFSRVTGVGGHIYAQGEGHLWTVENGALVEIATPFDASYVTGLAASDDGSLYAVDGCDVRLYRNNAWTKVTMDVGCITHIAAGPASTGSRVFVEVSNVLYEMRKNGTLALIHGFTSNIQQLLVRNTPAGEMVIVSETAGVTLVPTSGAALKLISSLPMVAVAANERFVYMAQADGVVLRWDGKTKDRLRTPAPLITDDATGHIYAYGGPIYVFSGLDFGELVPPSYEQNDEEMTTMLELPDGTVMAGSTLQIFTPDSSGAGWLQTDTPISPNSLRALAGIDKDKRFLAAYIYQNGQPLQSTLWRETAPTWVDTWPLDGPFVDGLWMDPVSGDVFAAGRFSSTKGFLGREPGTTSAADWESIAPTNCDLYGVHARIASHVVAVGQCDGAAVAWLYDGSAWSELHREPAIKVALRGVRVLASGDIFAVGDGGAMWFTGGAWHVDATVQGRSISGDDDDLWVSGAFTPIQHWDGTAWSRMTTRLVGTTYVSASKARVLMPGGAAGHVMLIRDNR